MQLPLFNKEIAIEDGIDKARVLSLFGYSTKSYDRIAALTPDTVHNFPAVTTGVDKFIPVSWNGVTGVIRPRRIETFISSLSCVSCGCRGNVYFIERHVNHMAPHYFNLYSMSSGGAVLMTADHILPDSLGGKYHPSNFQTMCQPCNQRKEHRLSVEEVDRVLANLQDHVKSWVHEDFIVAVLTAYKKTFSEPDPLKAQEYEYLFEKYRRFLTSSKAHLQRKACNDLRQALANVESSEHLLSDTVAAWVLKLSPLYSWVR